MVQVDVCDCEHLRGDHRDKNNKNPRTRIRAECLFGECSCDKYNFNHVELKVPKPYYSLVTHSTVPSHPI